MPNAVTYYAVNTVDGDVIDELPLTAFKFGSTLSTPAGYDGAIPVRSPKASDVNLEPWATSVFAAFDDRLIFGGPLVPTKAALGKGTVDLGGKDLLGYYAEGRRTVQSRAGMLYATGSLASDVRWPAGTDLFNVVGDLFRHAATFAGDPRPVVDRRGPGALGILGVELEADLAFATYERRGITELLLELAGGDPGFDFGLSYSWDQSSGNGQPVTTIELDAVRGRRTGLVLEAGKNITVLDYERDGANMANVIDAFGAGEADKMVRSSATAGGLIYPTGRAPRLERPYTNKRTTSAALLGVEARGELALRKTPAKVVTVQIVDTGDIPLGSFIAGDLVTLAVDDGFIYADGYWRITNYDVAFDNDGLPNITLNLTPEGAYGTLFPA